MSDAHPIDPAKKPGIRPGLLIALLAMLAATAWSLLQGDEPEPRAAKAASGKTASQGARHDDAGAPTDAALSGACACRPRAFEARVGLVEEDRVFSFQAIGEIGAAEIGK